MSTTTLDSRPARAPSRRRTALQQRVLHALPVATRSAAQQIEIQAFDFVGGGVEARLESLNCLGVFADGAYHFAADDNDEDYTIVRLGVKLPF